ncbi:MAG: alpha/beta hydrolase fold domain-containing protein [Planctomycetota bacterium]
MSRPCLNFRWWLAALFCGAMLVGGYASMRTVDAPSGALAVPDGVKFVPGIVYSEANGEALALDLAYPVAAREPLPLVICVHGGGWHGGSRAGLHPVLWDLAQRGYVAATVSYRLVPKHRFPAPVEDLKCAVRFLRAAAGKYPIDPERVGAIGYSAGAHLVAMLGVTAPGDKLEGACGDLAISSRLQAVVAMFGVFDLALGWQQSANMPRLEREYVQAVVRNFLGATPDADPDLCRRASPFNYVTVDDAPMLLLHGTKDPLVSIEQSKRFSEALRKADVAVDFVSIDGAGHGFEGKDLVFARDRVREFFALRLAKPPPAVAPK